MFAEFHPVVWMMDKQFSKIEYRYFNSGPIVEKSKGTHTDRNAEINLTDVSWIHGLAEVIQVPLDAGLVLLQVKECDYFPYDCFEYLE